MKKKYSAEPEIAAMDPGYHNRFGFPYNTTLSFAPLIRRLEENSSDPDNLEAPLIKEILKTVKSIPELLTPINDLSIITKYRREVDLLMSTVLPSSVLDELIAGVIIPFQPITIYGSKKFNEVFHADEQGIWDLSLLDTEKGIKELIAFCGMAILDKYYNFKMVNRSVLKNKELDKVTGAYTFYQPAINAVFAEVIALKEPKPLSEIDLSPLGENFFDTDFWLKNFPPDTFAFQGLTIYSMADITDRELISQLEYTLLQGGSINSKETIDSMQDKLRSYFRVPDLRIGITPILNYKGKMASCGAQNWFCIIPMDQMQMVFENFEKSIYNKAVKSGGPYLTEDISALTDRSPIEDELLKQGIRSIMILPIFQNDELIGAMEVGSGKPHQLDLISLLKLKDILPLISVAFQRAAKEFYTSVQTTIKEHFTSIHPSVEWKFAQAALDVIAKSTPEEEAKMPLIEFKDVTPVYGQIDIRSSSDTRNEAIRQDLIEYLSVAFSILDEAYKEIPLSILDELKFRIDKFLDKLHLSMDSGDETGILDFVKMEIEPTFKILSERSEKLRSPIERFLDSLDPEHENYHVRRTSFENSLTQINDLVAKILDDEEERTQKLVPHYFEKYKTDGVEYNIYLGQSILNEGRFDPMFVKSVRLWQLINMVNIARETHQLLPDLNTPLETTQLILCYSNPFAIMFRMDEKRFDVSGAYNIRYEIVKKRIDKAHVKGTSERITQPHKIAIIYTQDKETREYERYFEYLRSKGLITDEVEHLEVEPLQGMQGLKALRITVNYETEQPKLDYDEEELIRQVKDVMV